jgi:hypothetical protein
MGDKGRGKDKRMVRKAPMAAAAAGRRPHELRRAEEALKEPQASAWAPRVR